ncbi:MAG TPA: helix-turn-helix domain-containing protein [Pyrinomonadaceae bacterium]|nr:helix-turn-helix domain-containing protein [Pyrinomonadaceae bacterium]
MEAVRFLENRQHFLVEQPEAGAGSQSQSASSIKLEALKELTLALLKEVEALEHAQPNGSRQQLSLQAEVRRFEAEMIRWALARTGGHQRRAARLLGLKVTTLHAKIKRYKLGSYARPEPAADGEASSAGDAATRPDEGSASEAA